MAKGKYTQRSAHQRQTQLEAENAELARNLKTAKTRIADLEAETAKMAGLRAALELAQRQADEITTPALEEERTKHRKALERIAHLEQQNNAMNKATEMAMTLLIQYEGLTPFEAMEKVGAASIDGMRELVDSGFERKLSKEARRALQKSRGLRK